MGDDDGCLDIGCAFLLIAIVVGLIVMVLNIGPVAGPFLENIPLFAWIILIISIIVSVLLIKVPSGGGETALERSKIGKLLFPIALLILLAQPVFIFFSVEDNPAYTMTQFCQESRFFDPYLGGSDSLYKLFTARAKNEWDTQVDADGADLDCIENSGIHQRIDTVPVLENSAEIDLIALGNLSPDGTHYKVTLIQGDWGIWKIDHFQPE